MKYIVVKTECCNIHIGGPVGTTYDGPFLDVNKAYKMLELYVKEYAKFCSCKFEVKDYNE